MSRSIEAVLCYGVWAGEEIPWIDTPDDPAAWWRKQNGYKPLFDFTNALRPADVSAYFAEQKRWDDLHPMPILLHNDGDGDEECWIVAVPGTTIRTDWGSPVRLEPHSLDTSIPGDKLAAWKAFIAKYGITGTEGWFMFSYYC